jgi:hypothetical protein
LFAAGLFIPFGRDLPFAQQAIRVQLLQAVCLMNVQELQKGATETIFKYVAKNKNKCA